MLLMHSCGILNALLQPNQNEEDTAFLTRSLHKVRSSHDLEGEYGEAIKAGKGTIQKFELIGRPPRTLLIHLQRRTTLYGMIEIEQ